MECSFTLKHYEEILKSALEAGYMPKGFHEEVSAHERWILYLRHDLDICLEEAIPMAEVEAKLGMQATYFVLTNSPLYNLLSSDALATIKEIQSMGHWVGLHIDTALLPAFNGSIEDLVERLYSLYAKPLSLVRAVSFHRPNPTVLGKVFNVCVSTYEPRFFSQIKYVSDSRGTWREGCPCQMLSKNVHPRVQMLVHPIWWDITASDRLEDRLQRLLATRSRQCEKYLADNIEPIADLLGKGGLDELK